MPYRSTRRGALSRLEEILYESIMMGETPSSSTLQSLADAQSLVLGDPRASLFDANELGLDPELDDTYYPRGE